MTVAEIAEGVLESFNRLDQKEQIRRIWLGGNAEFVIRMLADVEPTTNVEKTAIDIRNALTRGLDELEKSD
jgi:hypothetical protein